MKKVLLTGVAGFVASRTAQLLLDDGVEVVGFDNLNDAYDKKLKDHRLDGLRKKAGFTFVEGDMGEMSELRPLFEKHNFDVVFNLGARAGVRYSIENPHVYMQSNAQGCLNILELMREFDVKKIVLASTSSLYAGQPMPFVETLPVDRPLSPYASSKKAAEVMCYTYHHLFDIDVTIFRYFTVYGPAGRPDMAPFRFIKWIEEGTPITVFGDGSQTRDFTYVDDIAKGTVLGAKKVGYEIFNLGGGKEPVALIDFIHMMEDRLGKKAEIIWKDAHPADMKDTSANIEKAKEILGWEPETGLEEGLDKTISWYLDNLDWASTVDIQL
ncbi:MAG: NAD-dependent epimerase/dehydratase family protein [Verrucomicrobiales bacterium]|nr:NAD-dependent epimerase/dehydratase family protein [Verrucomicrobiales bacterium]